MVVHFDGPNSPVSRHMFDQMRVRTVLVLNKSFAFYCVDIQSYPLQAAFYLPGYPSELGLSKKRMVGIMRGILTRFSSRGTMLFAQCVILFQITIAYSLR